MYKIKIKRGCTTVMEFGGKMCLTVMEKSQKSFMVLKKASF